eukprot:1601438-Pyramimonas_sp.AAC.1
MVALLTVLCKLSLITARDLAEIAGATFICFLLPANAAPVNMKQTAGQDYVTDYKERGGQHGSGPPWPHIFMAMVAHFRTTPADNKEPMVSQALAVLKHYWTQTFCLLAEH